jgi:hypothetical protein
MSKQPFVKTSVRPAARKPARTRSNSPLSRITLPPIGFRKS